MFFVSVLMVLVILIIIIRGKHENQPAIPFNIEEAFLKDEINFKLLKNPKDVVNRCFYSNDIYPELLNIDVNIVRDELKLYMVNNNKWINWPERDLYNNEVDDWKVIPIKAFNKWSTNIKYFPEMVKQLKTIKNLVTVGFSKLGPKTKLELHKGWGELSNNVLRCHLGIDVPKNKCNIFVIDEKGGNMLKMCQKNNKWIIFDDSLYHSASNTSNDKERIVLILDIERPKDVLTGDSTIKYSSELIKFMNEFEEI